MLRCQVKSCPHSKYFCQYNKDCTRLHQFPIHGEIRCRWEEWLRKVNRCELDPDTKPYLLFVCSKHFDEGCYTPPPARELRKEAVPSIAPGSSTDGVLKACSDTDNSICPDVGLLDVTNQPEIANSGEGVNAGKQEHGQYDEEIANAGSPVLLKKNKRLAYVGDITIADFETPERAKRSLSVIKRQFADMKAEIHNLRRALARAKEKFTHDKLTQLREEISETCVNNVKQNEVRIKAISRKAAAAEAKLRKMRESACSNGEEMSKAYVIDVKRDEARVKAIALRAAAGEARLLKMQESACSNGEEMSKATPNRLRTTRVRGVPESSRKAEE